MNWRALDRFPAVAFDGWQVSFGRRGQIKHGEQAVRKAVLRERTPTDPTLAAAPGQARMLPPLLVPTVRDAVHQRIMHRRRLIVELMLLLSASLLCMAWHRFGTVAFSSALYPLAIALFLFMDYWLVVRERDVLAERSLFFSSLNARGTADALPWLLLIGAITAAQIAVAIDSDAVRAAVATVRGAVPLLAEETFWRTALRGWHFGNSDGWLWNLVMLSYLITLASSVSRLHALAVFLVGTGAGALIIWWGAAPVTADALFVAPGVGALLGLCIGHAVDAQEDYPTHFPGILLGFGVLIFLLAWISQPGPANDGAIVALGIGWLWGARLSQRGIG